MADRVVIVGARRGNSTVEISQITQMMGRAGRKHDGAAYPVDLVIEESDEHYIADGLADDSGMDVISSLDGGDDLCFHVLGEIASGHIVDKDTARKWFARSLRALQGGEFNPDEVFDMLVELEAITMHNGRVASTPLGDASTAFYFHPADVLTWKMNFDELFEQGLECDEVAPAWALGSIPCNRATGDLGNARFVIQECCNRLPGGLDPMEGSLVNMTMWWHCMGGPPVGKMKNVAMSMKKDFGRIRSLLTVLDYKVARWGRTDYFEELALRIKLSVDPELLELCKLPGISKGRALFLYNAGVTGLDELKEQYENFEGEIDENFWNTICRLVR
jgi:replicative superfamily II helicase